MVHYPKEAEHSEKYQDDLFEYKHVILTKDMYDRMPKNKLLVESQWRALGVIQSKGWVHYTIFKPEPHILLFKRPIGIDPKTGVVPMEILHKLAVKNKKK